MSPAVAPAPAPDLRTLLAEHDRILLYDGVCGLCDSSVQFILDHDKRRTMKFATLQGDIGREALRALPALEGVDSVILLHRGGAWIRSSAVLEVGRYLGGFWGALAAPAWLIPRWVRDRMYDFIARNRYRLFGKLDACRIPSLEERKRFLDSTS